VARRTDVGPPLRLPHCKPGRLQAAAQGTTVGRLRGDEDALDELAAAEPPADDLLRELLASTLLSPASRAVLVLHFQEEMPLAEVAAVLEIPLGTAKSRLAYGLRALRRHLAEKRSL